MSSKTVYNSSDVQPVALYAIRDADSRLAYPILSTSSGTIAISTDGPPAFKKRYDPDGRDDLQAVYIGYALRGTAEDADGWTIEKYTYNTDGMATAMDIGYGTWDNRGSLSYD